MPADLDAMGGAWQLVSWSLGQPMQSDQVALVGPHGPVGDEASAKVVIVTERREIRDQQDVELSDGSTSGQVRVVVGGDLLGWIAGCLQLSAERSLPVDRLGRRVIPAAHTASHGSPEIDRLLRRLHEHVVATARARNEPYWWLDRWPDHHEFALLATHDMDKVHEREPANLVHDLAAIASPGRDGMRPATRSRAARRFARAVLNPIPNRRRLQAMLECEQRHDTRSTVFVHVDRRLHRYGARYSVHDRAVRSGLATLCDAGVELGLHTGVSYRTDAQGVRFACDALERACGVRPVGARSHYLCLDQPELFDALSSAGVEWDSTVGFTAGFGFRASTCQPHLVGRSPLVEVPMAVMDVGLLEHPDGTGDVLDGLVTAVRDVGGVLTLNWHTNMFGIPELDHLVDTYDNVLAGATRHGAWSATGTDLVRWYHSLLTIDVRTTQEAVHLSRRDDLPGVMHVNTADGAVRPLAHDSSISLARGPARA